MNRHVVAVAALALSAGSAFAANPTFGVQDYARINSDSDAAGIDYMLTGSVPGKQLASPSKGTADSAAKQEGDELPHR
ncbi:MAG: hypothetical protein QHC90_11785 [Shinella sp.]|nr:hypothetical protein [Shinella sp.]